jgi:3-phosphoshikimate 1-carboxyvinyltransferase
VAAALATGSSTLLDPLDADDTRVTAEGLGALGFSIRIRDGRWEIDGRGGIVPGGGSLRLRDSGTSFRMLTAMASLGERPSRLDGSERLRQRPVRELATALTALDAQVSLTPVGGGLPLEAGGTPVRGGRVSMCASETSQFASALLLIGSRMPGGVEISLAETAVSLPYIELTARVLEQFGVGVDHLAERRWRVPPCDYSGREYRVAGDHSSASYFLVAAAVLGGSVRVENLEPDCAQPDARLGEILTQLGCAVRRGADWIEVEGSGRVPPFDLDLRESPDLVPTLAVLALFSDGASALRGIAHLRLKESDRLSVLARNLRTLGREASVTDDALTISPPQVAGPHGGVVETASDHRIAMAFAVAGLRLPGVSVDDADCVTKSNPGFWDQLSKLESR